MSEISMIPRYYLYGDQHSDVELDFLHIEEIHERSGANNWIIGPHAHPQHIQVLLVTEGGGWIRMEEETYGISPMSLVVVPTSLVHEIRFEPGTDGQVITAAAAYLAAVAQGDPAILGALAVPAVYPLQSGDLRVDAVRDSFRWLLNEFIWSAPGRRQAIMAQTLRILVSVLRARSAVEHADVTRSDNRNLKLVNRFRDLLERHFRDEKGLSFYAGQMGVTVPRLNLACKDRCGRTASNLLYDRVIIEAKRYLLYTGMTVLEICHTLGFEDPAYFSRFFSQRAGSPPGQYRRDHTKHLGGDISEAEKRAEVA